MDGWIANKDIYKITLSTEYIQSTYLVYFWFIHTTCIIEKNYMPLLIFHCMIKLANG